MWNQLTLDVPDDLKDAVIGQLPEEGFAGVWESPIAEVLSTRLTLYFSCTSNVDHIEHVIREVFDRAESAAPAIQHSVVEECDWTEEWKKSYTCFPVGNEFFVIPSWVETLCPEDRLPIRIDPGQAFGTGTHETTQLTMEALERWVEPDHIVLDVGTGSGILALASRLLGARQVIACDIDPVAVQVALANVARNDEHEISTFCGSVDCIGKHSINLLLGNLTADVIVELFPEFDRVVTPAGLAIFSGVLTEQREDVLEACRRFHFTVHEEIASGEWLALITEKHVG